MEYLCTTSQTNAGGFVPLCSCGWIGNVHPAVVHEHPKTKKRTKDYDKARLDAVGEWRHHHKVTHVALLKPDPDRAREIVTHRGRWGTP